MSPQIRDAFTVNERWNRWRCEAARIDEPTSAPDGESERYIRGVLDELRTREAIIGLPVHR